jgi:tRNA threonylcarbamoyladenosine biosynthesis protein TsaE
MKKITTLKSLAEMNAFAAAFAKTLKGGEVLALTGELGAGKTAFTQGLAKALGIKQVVQSPTFLLMKCYPVKPQTTNHRLQTLCHVDAYRVKKENELIMVGLGEHMNDPATVTVIEWADLVLGLIPKNAIKMRFAHGKNDAERTVTVMRN